MAGSPQKRQRQERMAAIAADEELIADLIERVAWGDSIRALAAEYDVRYTSLWALLTEKHGETLTRARKAAALAMVDKNAENAEKVDQGLMNPKAASVSAKIREWIAGKWDREAFGEASRVDVNMKGTVALHVEAVRQLAQGATYDGQATERDVTPEPGEHPLL